MKDEQILKQAISKAVENGWKNPHPKVVWLQFYYNDIFSHSFAKAFWKHPKECKVGEPLCSNHAPWQAYLQKMVLEEEPLKYIEKFI